MKPFLNEDFLLSTPTARHLYHDIAAGLPIIDYHCHISPQENRAGISTSPTFPKSGWAAITINGALCAPAACPNA